MYGNCRGPSFPACVVPAVVALCLSGCEIGGDDPGIDDSGIDAVQIASGMYHTCALLADGSVKCWGENSDGQLGIGSVESSPAPVGVVMLGGKAVAISAGYRHTCALLETGGVTCWGTNACGELGDGVSDAADCADSYGEHDISIAPSFVPALTTGVKAIAAGGNFTCAVLDDGGVMCWGANDQMQLGGGSDLAATSTPVAVPGVTDVNLIAAGGGHVCVVTNAGAARCWGSDGFGQLGAGEFGGPFAVQDVIGLQSGVADITAGNVHTCVLMTTGGVKCWGSDLYSEIAGAVEVKTAVPTDIPGLAGGGSGVGAGWYHNCAVLEDGGVRCWGSDASGQSGGDGVGTRQSNPTPSAIGGLGGRVVQMAGGIEHTCVLMEGGNVRCWGSDFHGQLGRGWQDYLASPSTVPGVAGVIDSLAVGDGHVCTLSTDGLLQCWGANGYGQLGEGTTTARLVPAAVTGIDESVAQISCSGASCCGRLASGAVKCWGDNYDGQLGTGDVNDRKVPAAVRDPGGVVVDISTGAAGTCAVLESGEVTYWGRRNCDQLDEFGNCTYIDDGWQAIPWKIPGIDSVVSVAVGGGYACALQQDGTVKCWASFTPAGEVCAGAGVAWPSTPTAVEGLSGGVASIVSGGLHTCAVMLDGTVRCWGCNVSGQLGDGSTVSTLSAVAVAGLSGQAVSVAAGDLHTCASMADGGVKCWGENASGQLGDGTTGTTSTPVAVQGLVGEVAGIFAGGRSTCATLSAGGVMCWGDNTSGQLGNGEASWLLAPGERVK